MIVVNISSGLGNQLFQYGAGRALALARNAKLVGDPIAFAPRFRRTSNIVTHRSFALGTLQLPIEFRNIPQHALTSVRGYSRARRLLRDGFRAKYVCPGHFERAFATLPGDVLLDGYFQDRRYFLDNEALIVGEIADALSKAAGRAGVDDRYPARSRRIGAVHVRRGDYVRQPGFYPDWFEGYYRKICSYLIREYELDAIHIFSDDIAWCESAFRDLGEKVVFVQPDNRLEGIGDLVAMSRYSTLAIANSTFSWWAAAIAAMRGASIVVPVRWSRWNEDPTLTLYKPRWRAVSFV
jgi:hypothetical protein